MKALRSRGDVEVGDELPPLTVTPTNVSIFLFGVAFWTPHRVHYDKEWARSEGYDDVLVTGPLMTGYLVRMLTAWSGDAASVKRLALRNHAPAFAGDELTVRGAVASVTPDGEAVIAVSIVKDGTAEVVSGEAAVGLA